MDHRPLHLAVSEAIANEIRLGTYSDALPAMDKLAERFGVSRITLRNALKHLEVLGLVRIRQGSGSFVIKTSESASLGLIGISKLPNTLGGAISRYFDFLADSKTPDDVKKKVIDILDTAIQLASK